MKESIAVSRAEELGGYPLRLMAFVSHAYHRLGACVMMTSTLCSTKRLNAETKCGFGRLGMTVVLKAVTEVRGLASKLKRLTQV
jgi:hypothetical protein